MRTIRTMLVGATALVTAACASAINGNPDTIARLEQQRAAQPTSEAVERSLGIAYYKAKRYGDAHAALQQAMFAAPRDGLAALYLGLTAEAQNDVAGARKAYSAYLEVGSSRATKDQIRARMEALQLREIQVEARNALARESELAGTRGPENSVAVMPFAFSGPDTSLKPLGRGFAELVTTDLTRVSKLIVVERARLQAVLDEMELQKHRGTADGTGVRLGHILQVQQVIAGSIQQQGTELTTNALAVNAATSTATREARDRETIENVFTMEKNVVLELLENMHVQLTTAERNAIEQRPTRSLAAFVAFSRGLQLEDDGRFDQARQAFEKATRIDPNFGAARTKYQEAKAAATGVQVSATSLESSLRGTADGPSMNGAGTGAAVVANGLNPSPAAAATAGAGNAATPSTKDPQSGRGGDNPTSKAAVVTTTVGQPRRP